MVAVAPAIPAALLPLSGRIMDSDSHEYTPSNYWVEQFGSVTQDLVDAFALSTMPLREPIAADATPINAETVWKTKLSRAPGAFDLRRRLEVMDFTGVERQIVFPGSVGIYGVTLYFRADTFPDMLKSITGDRKGYARKLITAYNDFCVRIARMSDRLRPVGIAFDDTIDELYANTRRLIDKGVRAFWIPSASLPGGVSPADPALDKFWALLANADAPALAHVGADFDFLKTGKWRDAPAFQGWKAGEEFSMDPWTLSVLHLPVQNFVATMVMGGVFERHPRLRYGACEVLGQWLGPLAQNLDLWFEHSHKFTMNNTKDRLPLSMKPSEYIRRNVRASLFDIEPVDEYIRQYNMPELYCYSSDYPHMEGGKDPMGDISRRLAPHGPLITKKVFVDNGEWLMPA